MRTLPSVIPSDRLDRDMYLVLEDFSGGAAWRETDEDRTDYRTLISDFSGENERAGQSAAPRRSGFGLRHIGDPEFARDLDGRAKRLSPARQRGAARPRGGPMTAMNDGQGGTF